MPDTPTPPPSHGTPVVSSKLVPYFAVGAALSSAIVVATEMGLDLGNPHVKSWAIVAGLFFATLLGTSPGWRK